MNKAQQESARRIKQAAQLIVELVPLEVNRSSQKRKHDMEVAYGMLSLHAGKLHLQSPRLSTFYDPEQYLRYAQDVLDQLARLEAITQPGVLPVEMNGNNRSSGWRVQPEESTGIDYRAFLLFYGFTRQQIDWLIAMIQHYYPKMPVQNRTVEWAMLRQRDMEGQDLLAKHYEASSNATWYPHDAPWWNDPVTIRQRAIIALYFGEYMHAAYPSLHEDDAHEYALVRQIEGLLSRSIEQLTDLQDLKKMGTSVARSEILLPLAHVIGCFISLTHLSAGSPDRLDLVWNKLSELGDPTHLLIANLAMYYERLAEREPPMKDDVSFLIDVFLRLTNESG